ncbi:uncharacterized protein LOC123553845 isoform X2 [Mercenaria mercenaria]|uniref:uncharacterized protein LOC123553845 isoform X2 n=1 Tax=Mercenaria mercenaria TaxID=6596 RepID=UPI00234F72C6|nr:uncharacterized protein LOC123553845 isoform X2 [Mercenaria mercenaria]XP_053404730.1 uncharacterized protein LOC123553845 isoform X2 [Mercenaria mercenaria]
MSLLKMEYITVLKNPETHIDIGNNAEKIDNQRTVLKRLCSHFDKRNLCIGVLMLFTLISFLTQLPLHMQVQTHDEQIKKNVEKIKDLIIVQEIILQSFEGNYDTEKASKKGGRQTRTASSSIPHFYLNGSRSSGRVTDVYGHFIWKRPEHRTFNRDNDFFDATINSDNSLTKVRILRSGVYFVFAKVTANGRSPLQSNVRPSVGIYLKKNDEVLDIAWTTQDNRGGIYNVLRGHYSSDEIKYPMDSLSVSGLHRLEANDEIYVQRPPDTVNSRVERFLVENNKAGFGAFLVEAECSSC